MKTFSQIWKVQSLATKTKEKIEEFGYANTVTMIRIFFIPVFMVVLLVDWPQFFPNTALWYYVRPLAAALVFTILAATDGVDGYLARSRNEITTFGKFADPLADKLLVTAALLALIEIGAMPAWIALIIIAREFVISGLRMVASAEGVVIAASWYGKIKTVFQIIAIIMFIIMDSASIKGIGNAFHNYFVIASWFMMGIALIMTIISMVDYFKNAANVIEGPWNKKD